MKWYMYNEWNMMRDKHKPRLVSLAPPLLWYGGRLFSGIPERWKQAGDWFVVDVMNMHAYTFPASQLYDWLVLAMNTEKCRGTLTTTTNVHTSLAFAGPSGISVGLGIEQWQIRGRKAPQLRLGHLRVIGLLFCPICTLWLALDLTV